MYMYESLWEKSFTVETCVKTLCVFNAMLDTNNFLFFHTKVFILKLNFYTLNETMKMQKVSLLKLFAYMVTV